jgi:hypothetical protein
MFAADLARQGREARKLFEDAFLYHEAKVEEAAASEREYRKARAKAHVQAPRGTVDTTKAWVDAETADLRYLRDLAAGQVRGALELVRQRRQELTFLQTQANASKEEAAFARTGPDLEPVA